MAVVAVAVVVVEVVVPMLVAAVTENSSSHRLKYTLRTEIKPYVDSDVFFAFWVNSLGLLNPEIPLNPPPPTDRLERP